VATTNYETVFIAEPEISNDQVDQLINKIKQSVTASNGTVAGEDRWGRRRLAYPIQGHREGFYAVITFTADTSVVNSVEHLFAVTDSVIRHMTTKVIKKTKKFAPRRERSAGAAEGGRPAGRTGGPSRGRPEFTPKPSSPAPGQVATGDQYGQPLRPEGVRAPAAAAEPGPIAPAPTAAPEGGTSHA